ncbi:MAG: hypothetical protein PF569_09950 [Candidatus Woesearchaeota archaeon]|nr:hypothetical protein [Candidatus Woesearchaeota archaeon]
MSLGVEIVDEKTAKILIYPDIDFNIKGFLPGHDYLSYQGNVSANTSLNLAFIGVIKYTLVQATFFGNSIQAAYFQYSPSEYYGDNIAVQVIGTGLDESIQLVWGDLYDVERYEQVLQLEESAIITAPYVNETVLSGNLYDNIPENTEDYYVTRQVDSGTLVLAKNLFYSLQ